MDAYDLRALEEYSAETFVVKPVHAGAASEALLLHLLPGQAVPRHPHPGQEGILLPQRGEAVLVGADGAATALRAGTLCPQGVGPTSGIENRGTEPFQMLVLLVRTADAPG